MPFVVLEDLAKSFGATAVLRALDLALEEGETVALLGPSGSGKTTALRLLAGFETPDRGRIVVAGEDVTRLPPARRRFGMVFQHYALFPHLDVGENVGFGLHHPAASTPRRRSPGARAARATRIAEALALVDLAGFERRRVSELSGGQQQRVALARALAPEPRVLLLDEPLSNLDPGLRVRTRRELGRLIRRLGITTMIVTHEQEEAFALADRVAVLHRGSLAQVAPPAELYRNPASPFVAAFVGRAALLPGVLRERSGARGVVELAAAGDRRVTRWEGELAADLAPGALVWVAVRPESLRLLPPGAEPGTALAGRVVERRPTGPGFACAVELADFTPVREVEVLAPMSPMSPTAPAERRAVDDPVAVAPAPEGPAPRIFPRDEASRGDST